MRHPIGTPLVLAAILVAAILVAGPAFAQDTAIVLPAGGHAQLETERAAAERAVTRALEAHGLRTVTSAQAARRLNRTPCETLDCVPSLLEATRAAMAVMVAVWGQSDQPGPAQVGVTLIDPVDARASGTADVEGADVSAAAARAIAQALAAWETRAGIPVRIEGTPPGAAITVDRHPVGAVPTEVRLPPGVHRLAVSSNGYITERREIEVGSEPQTVRVELAPDNGAPNDVLQPETPEPGVAVERERSALDWLVAGGLVAGGAAVGVAGLVGVIQDGDLSGFGTRGERRVARPIDWIGLVGGAVAVVAGVVVWIAKPFAVEVEVSPERAMVSLTEAW